MSRLRDPGVPGAMTAWSSMDLMMAYRRSALTRVEQRRVNSRCPRNSGHQLQRELQNRSVGPFVSGCDASRTRVVNGRDRRCVV
jgi:hypothetical protein